MLKKGRNTASLFLTLFSSEFSCDVPSKNAGILLVIPISCGHTLLLDAGLHAEHHVLFKRHEVDVSELCAGLQQLDKSLHRLRPWPVAQSVELGFRHRTGAGSNSRRGGDVLPLSPQWNRAVGYFQGSNRLGS